MRSKTLLNGVITLLAVAAIGCTSRLRHNTPPAQQLLHPGPGVAGPGPGVLSPGNQFVSGGPQGPAVPWGPGGGFPGGCENGACSPGLLSADDASFNHNGVQPVQYCEDGSCHGGACFGPGPGPGVGSNSQIAFVGEQGLQISWSVSSGTLFDSAPIVVPARQDFPQGAIYRLKLSNIPGRAGVSLYPTLEVAPVTPRTDAYLAHAPVPIQFTEEDFDQVLSGNFVTKVVYLPDPEFQELALAGVETLVSTRLDPGADPVAEADKRGSILAIVRIGNKDLEATGNQFQGGVLPAQFDDGSGTRGIAPTPAGSGEFIPPSPAVIGEPSYPGPSVGAPQPLGAPTAGFVPQVVPPHLVAGAPQYGHPITGTPIGLPGPPHLPHGSPAGLQRHTIWNGTNIKIPPPTPAVNVTVAQRPGLSYPKPVNRIHIAETNRHVARPLNGKLSNSLKNLTGRVLHSEDCEDCE